jgi:hypothetical protein
MTGGGKNWQSAIVVIVTGVTVCPAALYLFMSPGAGVADASMDYSLVAKASLPFLASAAVLAITREPRLGLWSALVPLVASIVFHLIVAASVRSDPLAGILLRPLVWLNLLLLFPLGLWVGFRSLNKKDRRGESSDTSLDRTREG